MLKNVVLPAPFGPMSDTMDFSGMRKSTSLTAMRPPNSLRTAVATSRSVIGPVAVGVRALERDVVERRVVHPELYLLFVPTFGDEAGGPEQHHQHDDQAVDPELVLRHVLDPRLRPDRGQALDVEPPEDHPAEDHAPDRAHAAEDHHAEQEDRDVEVEVRREGARLEARVEGP